MTRTEIADLIQSFLDGSCSEWDWDDFLHTPLNDPEFQAVQNQCAALPLDYPPTESGHYTNSEGTEVLKNIVSHLRR